MTPLSFDAAHKPVFLIHVEHSEDALAAKLLASSLSKSFFAGRIVILHPSPTPYFTVERKQIEEYYLAAGDSASHPILEYSKQADLDPRQWVIFSSPSAIALRNIDHLLPEDLGTPYGPPEIDLYWTPVAGGDGSRNPSPWFWAVRAEHLETVVAAWKGFLAPKVGLVADNDSWKDFIGSTELRKKPFESGETVVASARSLDWVAASESAFVVAADWPEAVRWKFLQGLFFERYFGDDTGLLFHILES